MPVENHTIQFFQWFDSVSLHVSLKGCRLTEVWFFQGGPEQLGLEFFRQ